MKWSLFRKQMLAPDLDAALCLATQEFRQAREAWKLAEAECERTLKQHEENIRTMEARRKVMADAKLRLDAIIYQRPVTL